MADGTTDVVIAEVLGVDQAALLATGSAGFGLTEAGFAPKGFARILAEKLALARLLLGAQVDLTSGSLIRKLLEVSALEDARTWAALSSIYDDSFVSTATGDALSRLGEELGLPRPFLQAIGSVKLTLAGNYPKKLSALVLPRGVRMLTPNGDDVALAEDVSLVPGTPVDATVEAFYPGKDGNLDPKANNGLQAITDWNPDDEQLQELLAELRLEWGQGAPTAFDKKLVAIVHLQPLTGGELRWPDDRYRDLLLRAPRSIWTAEALEIAVSLVPGVRQVQVRDAWGGLDIQQSIFGDFNFSERVFSAERDLASPYFLTILVAPSRSAIWAGTGNLAEQIESAAQDLRPISIFPNIVRGTDVGVTYEARIVVSDVPLPEGNDAVVNASRAAAALKGRLAARVAAYIDSLRFGEPVRAAEVTWALMSEPGVVDVQDLQLVRFPGAFNATVLDTPGLPTGTEVLAAGENVIPQGTEIALYVDLPNLATVTAVG